MIKSFKCKETQKIFDGKNSKIFKNIQSVAKRKLDMLHFAFSEQDLRMPPSNHFEHLKGNLKGHCSIRINDQYRIIFRIKNDYIEDVRIADYHK